MKKVLKYLIILFITFIAIVLIINLYMIFSTNHRIKKQEELDYKDIDCILILGAGIRGNKPSPMLEDRLLTGIEIYDLEITKKIIVSGDHGRKNYDEVNVMKTYLIKNDIPSENIFMDHAGFSTYDSIYRTKDIFKAKKVLIITQKYHLHRALHIAKQLGLEAYGVSATKRDYFNQIQRDAREMLARIKDFVKCLFKPEPKYLGESIPLTNNGDITNDK